MTQREGVQIVIGLLCEGFLEASRNNVANEFPKRKSKKPEKEGKGEVRPGGLNSGPPRHEGEFIFTNIHGLILSLHSEKIAGLL